MEVRGGEGDDVITVGNNIIRDTVINGGDGDNTLVFDGTKGSVFSTLTNFKTFEVAELSGNTTLLGEFMDDALEVINFKGDPGANLTMRNMAADSITMNLDAEGTGFANTITYDGTGTATVNIQDSEEDGSIITADINLTKAESVTLNVEEDAQYNATMTLTVAEQIVVDADGTLGSSAKITANEAESGEIASGEETNNLSLNASSMERLMVTAEGGFTLTTDDAANLNSLVRLDVTADKDFEANTAEFKNLSQVNLDGAGKVEFATAIGADSETVTVDAVGLYGDEGAAAQGLNVMVASFSGTDIGTAEVTGSEFSKNIITVLGNRNSELTGGYEEDTLTVWNTLNTSAELTGGDGDDNFVFGRASYATFDKTKMIDTITDFNSGDSIFRGNSAGASIAAMETIANVTANVSGATIQGGTASGATVSTAGATVSTDGATVSTDGTTVSTAGATVTVAGTAEWSSGYAVVVSGNNVARVYYRDAGSIAATDPDETVAYGAYNLFTNTDTDAFKAILEQLDGHTDITGQNVVFEHNDKYYLFMADTVTGNMFDTATDGTDQVIELQGLSDESAENYAAIVFA